MLNHLTRYLLQHKKLSIPTVGTLTVVQHPAQLMMAEKMIMPPSYSLEISKEADVPEHQLQFLNTALGKEESETLKALSDFGKTMRTGFDGEGFYWEGIGNIRSATQTMPLTSATMNPVIAEKVIRQDASHAVLVGDREMTLVQMADRKTALVIAKRYPLAIIIGWVMLILSIIAIALILYAGKFNAGASGSKFPTSFTTKLLP